MRISSSAALLLLVAGLQSPCTADIAPEVVDRLRSSVVTVETGDGTIGTGFFVGEEGLILTCSHVMDLRPGEVGIRFFDGSEGLAEFVSFDPVGLDLAALRLKDGKPPAFLEPVAAAPRPGQRVFQAGNPYPLFPSLMSTGIVGHHRATHHIFVHDAASSSGSSGCPVVDQNGKLLGMTISISTDDSGNSDSSYSSGFASAIDMAAIRRFLDRVAEGERSDVKTGHIEYLSYPLPVLLPGQAVDGRLTEKSDRNGGDLSFSQGYLIDLEEGDLVIINLESDEFDTYLLLHDNDAGLVMENDDAPGDEVTNSQIVFDVPESARYVIIANSLERGETGAYRLRADTMAFAEPEVREGEFRQKDPRGQGGQAYQSHPIEGKPGQWLSITMRSDLLDSMLYLIGPDGSAIAENDDWKEGTLDARILTRIEHEGEYQIITSTAGGGDGIGPFELEIMWSAE